MVDVLILGATGYTGKLITRYLATHQDRDSFKFGLAGRSKSKLDQLISETSLSDTPTYTVNVSDDLSIKALLHDSQAKVVLTCIGPFYRWGKPIARACAEDGVHYVDITGESSFVKDLIEELESLAVKTNAIMIPSAGFDSVPSDAIAYLSARTLRSALKSMSGGHGLENVGVEESHTIVDAKIGISGGSIASVANMRETIPLKQLIEVQAPDSLSPIKLRSYQGPKLVYSMPMIDPKRFGHYAPTASHNVAIVQRTRALFQLNANNIKSGDVDDEDVQPAYAEDFTYVESWEASNRFIAFFLSLAWLLGGAGLLLFPPVIWLVKRLLPPGQGPSDETLEKGWLKMDNVSISTPLPETGKRLIVESHLHGQGEAGYALTAVMASEVALALLTPREKLLPLARQGGVLTPMAALGPIMLKRLSTSGRFEFESKLKDE